MVLTRCISLALMCTLFAGITNAEALSSITAKTAGDGNFTISVADVQDLVAIDVTLTYDAGTFSNPQIQPGAFASAAYSEANTLTPGTVRAVYMYITDGVFTGAGQLAKLTFTTDGAAQGCLKELKADGYSKTGQLVAIKPEIVCQKVPTCSADQNLVNGVCVPKTPTCAADQVLVNGVCVAKTPACTADQDLVNGVCVAKTAAFKVTPLAGAGGGINPGEAVTVYGGSFTSFTMTPATGYQISGVSGCGGTLNGNTFTTAAINADCTVTASFSLIPVPVSTPPDTSSEQTASSSPGTSSGNMGNIIDQAAAQQAANANSSVSALPSGIITGSGKTKPDISDALRAVRIAIGLIMPTPADLAAGDVAPLVNGKPAPDGKIGIEDAILILRKSLDLINW
jgi:hypothetical protein